MGQASIARTTRRPQRFPAGAASVIGCWLGGDYKAIRMADEDSTGDGADAEGFWAPGREAVLRDMWMRGLTGSQIGRMIGAKRQMVIAKAHRLKLRQYPEPLHGTHFDPTPFLEEIGDPIVGALGASTMLDLVIGWNWPNGAPYLDRNVGPILRKAVELAMLGKHVQPLEISGGELLQALLTVAGDSRTLRTVAVFEKHLHLLDILPINSDTRIDQAQVSNAIHSAVLRWDAVQIMSAAAGFRARIVRVGGPIEVPHLLAAFICTPAGQAAMAANRFGDEALEPLRSFVSAVFSEYTNGLGKGADRSVAELIETEIRDQHRFRGPRDYRAGYTTDAIASGEDALGASWDAKALADLILLKAAAPPLAIGIFGTWGSGKSTLLAELRAEIARQAERERDLRIAGMASANDPVERVAGVMQLEFNAWSFADSDNLWAALTSDLFEQIATARLTGDQGVGARMVAEVAERSSKEAVLLRRAQASLEDSRERLVSAGERLAAAEVELRASKVDAAFDVAVEMLTGKKPGKKKLGNGDDDKDLVAAGDADTADEGDADSTADTEQPESASDVFAKATLIGDGASIDTKIKSYADAGTPLVRSVLMAWDWARAKGWTTVLLGVAGGALAAGAFYILEIVLPAWPGRGVRHIVSSAAGFLLLVGGARLYILPALRAAALLSARIGERKETAQAHKFKALQDRRAAEADKAAAEKGVKRSRHFVEKYADVREIGSSPGLMLDYLLKDSAEIDKVRGSLGLLGTVRKAFEKLNAIIQENAKDPMNQIQRIIIYIDDLDRCSQRQVVQILEAIHLLLAFPCFVVVAAVDVRWLEAALAAEHDQIGAENSTICAADYLEKIFQIPFWVRVDDDHLGSGYDALLGDLIGDTLPLDEEDEDRDGDQKDDDLEDAPAEASGPSYPTAFERVTPVAPDLSVPVERERIRLGPEEQRVFRALAPLAARSPRAVKRMVNIYRLIRVNAVTTDGRTLVRGPGIEATPVDLVQFALACEAGIPAKLLTKIVKALLELTTEEWGKWQEHVAAQPREAFPPGQLWSVLSASHDVAFRLVSGLRALSQARSAPIELSELSRAFLIVGRYSFRIPPDGPPTQSK
jgi:hypothetical protein